MKKVILAAALGAACLGACGDGDDGVQGDDQPDANGLPALDCQVVVIGGGAGGLHTAFRLAPTLHDGVCLFEKEDQLGGRIKDEPFDPSDPQSPRMGTGARRVMEGQQVLFDLADELGMTLEMPALKGDFINARGMWSFHKEDFLPAYPSITPDASGDTETAIYDHLRLDASATAHLDDYPDFRGYIRGEAGAEQLAFLHDMSRFRADFEVPVDARGYIDYLNEEWDVCCTPSYPVGGMSQFILGMEAHATDDGARIFKSEPVSDISRDGARYRITTSGHVVEADKVVIAVPPAALDWITGDVADDIKAQAEYKAIIGVKVVTVTQWWPTAWWSTIADPAAASDGTIWRAWSTEHCFNFIEIPVDQYGIDQKVTRSVYDDDPDCVEFWQNTYENGGTAAVEAEIKRGMEYMFDNNGVSTPATVTIPDPLKTYVQIWPAAWHWLRAGIEGSITNADLFDWATHPLGDEPVGMVGEAYNVQRSGWSDGAYKSSIHLLNTQYGMSLPGLSAQAPATPRANAPWGLHRN
jgi:hypothetical protein